MLGDRRVWWGTAAVFLGLGTALLTGAGIASADSSAGGSGRHADSSASETASPSAGSTSSTAATGKHRAAPAAVVSGSRAQAPAPTATSTAPAAVTVTAAGDTAGPPTRTTQHVAALRSLAAPVANAPPTTPVAAVALDLLAGLGAPAPATDSTPRAAVGSSNRTVAAEATAAIITPPDTNGVTGVKVGHSTLTIPAGSTAFDANADWYFPTQADGTVAANGVIWLQHGFLASKDYYSSLATTLAQQTNSIVVAPTLPSFPSFGCPGCTLYGVPLQQGAASMFTGPETALNVSANAAGYQGTLPQDFVLAGHSAGGGWSVGVGGYYIDSLKQDDQNHLLGVVMYDGVVMNGTMAQSIASLDKTKTPVYQIAAPAQQINAFGITTDQLAQLRPNQFIGDVLVNGSHVDSMLGSNPLIDFSAQLVTRFSPPGNTQATYTLSTGWINDFYYGGTPQAPKYGLYGTAGQPVIMGDASAVVLPTPIVDQLGPVDQVLKAVTAKLLPWIFGGLSGAATVTPVTPVSTSQAQAPDPTSVLTNNGVTGVKTGHSTLTIPVGTNSYTAPADWYFPTQADGSVKANGIIYLQHGFLSQGGWYSSLAMSLAQQTNSIVVAPTLPSFPSLFCSGCYLSGTPMQQGVAELFLGDRAALNISASQAGYQGTLPAAFVLSGHSAGGGLAAIAGGYYEDALAPGAPDNLLGVVMFDGVAISSDAFNTALTSLAGKPVYQIAAPPQTWNNNGQTTTDLIAGRPGQFVGAQLVNGSHVDSMLGSNPVIDFFAQLVTKFSPPGNTQAVYTLADGWINDFYTQGTPQKPNYGYYGTAGQPILMGQTAAIVLPTQPAAATASIAV